MPSGDISPKRRLFCRQYILENGNATAAALKAGYSERSAKSQASQMLALPEVQAEIGRLRAADAEAADITKEKLFRISTGFCEDNMAVAVEATTPEAPAMPVDIHRFIEAQYRRNQYVVNLTADYPYADLFKPEAWKAIARTGKVNMGDTIEVRKDDLSLWALLLVRESIPNHARIVVAEIFKKELPPVSQDAGDDEQFEIKHLGMQDQWAVLNRSTQRVLTKGLKSRDAARSYINTLRPQMIGR